MNEKFSWLIILTLFTTPTYSGVNNTTNTTLPLPPRLSVWASSGNNTFGEADAMIPFFGNLNQTLYGDISGKYGDDRAWFASLGLGGRKIVGHNTILGAYLFTDYNKTSNSHYFRVFNPGIEFMTLQWDGHLNAYLPIGRKSDLIGTLTSHQLGIPDVTFFSGHAQYAPLFDMIENVGPGFDLELGHTFYSSSLNRTRVFAGGYHFNPKYTSNIHGVEAGVEMPLKYKWASVELRDSYDNVNHNTLLLTLRFTFGGLDKSAEPDIHDGMLDRIPRHLANLNNGDGIPSKKSIVNSGRAVLIQDNIWFFNADGTPTVVQGFQSCTFEHPCIGLAQSQIDTINALSPNANFYLSSGIYNNPDLGSGFIFYDGQNVFGRTRNFSQLATGNARPLLNDSVILEGYNNLYNLRINGQSVINIETGGGVQPFQVGVLARSFPNARVNIYNSEITANSTTNSAVAVINNSPATFLNIYNSTLTSSTLNVPGSVSIGAANLRSGTLNIYGSTVRVTESDLINNFNVVFGIVNNENGVINMTNTNVIVSATNAGLAAGVLNNSSVGAGTINIVGTNITVVADNVGLASAVFNQANNLLGLAGTVNIDQSSLSLTSNNNGGGLGAAIFNSNDGRINLTNSILTSSGNEGAIYGIAVFDPLGTVNFQNNSISVNLFGTATGDPIISVVPLNDLGGNQCFKDGAPVPC